MAENNALKDKSFKFAIRCIRLGRYLRKEKKEYEMASQLVRSGTSIGANVKEAQFAQSKADFNAKMSIAKKEAGETEYWLELLLADEIITEQQAASMLLDCREIIKLLVSTCKKTGLRETKH